ncbi:MAG: transposase [Gammaproteobacteria bacterium]|nr:transposase [Gammaproteobacteria bacterium]
MPTPRKNQVCLDSTPYYHCISRCVRRAFLCGNDEFSGQSYEHRKQWVVDKLAELAGVFSIDVCAYAVMSNHYHLVLHINQSQAQAWSDETVIERWTQLFKAPLLIDRMQKGEQLIKSEQKLATELVQKWRSRLTDLGWFMRCLNESLARQANTEDNCTGRFWEGRYKSQALLDEQALLTCMSYVDLNPIRAGINPTPETSDYTSIQARIQTYQNTTSSPEQNQAQSHSSPTSVKLTDFIRDEHKDQPEGIAFSYLDYLELVDWSGRAIRDDKAGAIADNLPPILDRLGIEQQGWLDMINHYDQRFFRAVGAMDKLKQFAHRLGQCWMKGQSADKCVYKQTLPT